MNLKHLLFCFVLIPVTLTGQIKYENGYIIDKSGKKTECLIKNLDWKTNPHKIDYKAGENGEVKTVSAKEISEFGINGASKFVSATVNIDRSSDQAHSYTFNSQPEWSREVIFLRVLIEGKATLYSYEEASMTRFFYSTSDTSFSQLIHKRYIVRDEDREMFRNKYRNDFLGENNQFRQQLWENLKCEGITMSSIKAMTYSRSNFIRFFINYNTCSGSSVIDYYNMRRTRTKFNLWIVASPGSSSLEMHSPYIKNDFGNAPVIRIGAEAELLLPYNKGKWALIVEPTYQKYFIESPEEPTDYKMEYSGIEIPVGLRYYMFLGNNNKLFVEGLYMPPVNIYFNSRITKNGMTTMTMEENPGLIFGAGYQHNRLRVSFRYFTDREFMNYTMWKSSVKGFSIDLGYRILGK